MYSVEVTCAIHGKSFSPADDASCRYCDDADEIMDAMLDSGALGECDDNPYRG